MGRLHWLLFAFVLCGCDGCRGHVDPGAMLPPSPKPTTATIAERPAPVETPRLSPSDLEPQARHDEPAEPPPTIIAVLSAANRQMRDVYFELDSSDLNASALAALQHDATILSGILTGFPSLRISIEGHCDERGSAEYNLGLGDRRARRASEALRGFAARLPEIEIVSYGKEAPQCTEQTESCWQRNRRAHVVLRQ